ncbi:hypothetical protein [Bdellovibrio bacteriovorus]|nr:hypothetical protein [Bdellovibrio bacteriovorus]
MRTMLLMIVSLGHKVINGNCEFSTPSYHRFNVLGGGAFVVSEQQD